MTGTIAGKWNYLGVNQQDNSLGGVNQQNKRIHKYVAIFLEILLWASSWSLIDCLVEYFSNRYTGFWLYTGCVLLGMFMHYEPGKTLFQYVQILILEFFE